MKRVLIFLFVFPAIAAAVFYAVLYVLTGAVPDSLSGTGVMVLVLMGPALVIAGVDWSSARLKLGVIGTALFGFAAAALFAELAWEQGFTKEVFVFGLVGGIPAAVCSWLVQNNKQARRLQETGAG